MSPENLIYFNKATPTTKCVTWDVKSIIHRSLHTGVCVGCKQMIQSKSDLIFGGGFLPLQNQVNPRCCFHWAEDETLGAGGCFLEGVKI